METVTCNTNLVNEIIERGQLNTSERVFENGRKMACRGRQKRPPDLAQFTINSKLCIFGKAGGRFMKLCAQFARNSANLGSRTKLEFPIVNCTSIFPF